jgi:predicted nucleic acid-binding protein
MPADAVLDASVAAKVFITEVGSDAARRFVQSGVRLIAPDLVLVELANVAVKRVRQGMLPRAIGERMAAAAASLFSEIVPTDSLVASAFVLSADHGFSTYDATYVALAEQRGCQLVTADQRLIARAASAGVAADLRTL